MDDETVTVTLPDVPKGTDPNHRLPLLLLAEAKLVMTDALMNMASVDQAEFPIDDDEEIETVEVTEDPSDDPVTGTVEDTAGKTENTSEEIH